MQLSGHTTMQTGKLEATRGLVKSKAGNTKKIKDWEREGKRELRQGEEKREKDTRRERHTVVQGRKEDRHTAAEGTEGMYISTEHSRQQLVRSWVQDLSRRKQPNIPTSTDKAGQTVGPERKQTTRT